MLISDEKIVKNISKSCLAIANNDNGEICYHVNKSQKNGEFIHCLFIPLPDKRGYEIFKITKSENIPVIDARVLRDIIKILNAIPNEINLNLIMGNWVDWMLKEQKRDRLICCADAVLNGVQND